MNNSSMSDERGDSVDDMPHTGAAAARRHGWSRLAKWLAGGGLLGLAWLLYQPTSRSWVYGVGPIEVITYNQHRSIVYDVPRKARHDETVLLLKYYTRGNYEAAVFEAERVASTLFDTADTLNVDLVRLMPSDPLLLRNVPLVTFSWTVDFRRDSVGAWRRTSN